MRPCAWQGRSLLLKGIAMFKKYYVTDNEQADGYHEVHVQGCTRLKQAVSVTQLGVLPSYGQALSKAKEIYGQVKGCFFCSPIRHYQ